jgi:hypothetical protein
MVLPGMSSMGILVVLGTGALGKAQLAIQPITLSTVVPRSLASTVSLAL